MIVKIAAVKLVWDTSLYPRKDASEVYVNQLVEALEAGAAFPPIIVDQNKRIIDGVHRWKAQVKHFGETVEVGCDERKYASDGEAFLDAIMENSGHGLRFTPFEQTRCLTLAEDKGVSKEQVAMALRITYEKAQKIMFSKTAISKNGKKFYPLKGSMHDFHGEVLSKKQHQVNEYSGGMRPLYYINQLIGLIEAGIISKLSEEGVVRLQYLRDLLIEKFPTVRAGKSGRKSVDKQN